MNTSYETVVDPATIIPTLVAVAIHVAFAVLQGGLIGFLFGTGIHNLFFADRDGPWLQRLGATRVGAPDAKTFGVLRLGLALLLLLPLLVGAPFLVSLASCLGSLGLMVFLERGIPDEWRQPGRAVRLGAVVAAAGVALFMIWEQEDSLALSVELAANANQWRVHELEWQLEHDVEAPKVGDLAPDFTLQDPSGAKAVRLSDFRGKRPVALIFGSYT